MIILAIGAHADDVELGCGGTLARWAAEGHSIHICVVTDSAYSSPKGVSIRSAETATAEAESASRLLRASLHLLGFPCLRIQFDESLNAALRGLIEELHPDVVLTHWADDSHHDHRMVGLASIHAARHIPRLLTYRSNWQAGTTPFAASVFVDIEDWYVAKLALVRAHGSEHGRTGDRWETFLQSEARQRGLEAACGMAEGFQPIRWVL